MEAFEREVCRRLPLADAVFTLLDFCIPDDFLDQLFDRHRGRSYQDLLTFPHFVQLIADSLLDRQRSAHHTFRQALDLGTLPTCVEAVYGKLRRVPLPLSQALLAEATARLRLVFPDAVEALPASLDGLDVFAFDGKKIKFVAKRLKCLRAVRGQVLGGKLVVAQDVRSGLAVAFAADADGEASDNSLVAGAVAQVREQGAAKPRLWVGDRLFCDLRQIPVLTADGDHFLLRHQSKVGFHPDTSRLGRPGVDARGIGYTEEWGWLGAAGREDRQYVRRITLHRPASGPIVLVTDLLDADVYPAADLLETYLRRWGIEKLFQRVTDVFDLRHLIGCSPQATVFQASFCLLLSNVIQAVQGYVAEARRVEPQTISTRMLFEDVAEELTAWHKLVGVGQTVEWVGGGVRTAAQVMAYLRGRLDGVWKDGWNKASTKKRKEKPPTEYLKGGHSSVYRIQRGLHKVTPETAPASG